MCTVSFIPSGNSFFFASSRDEQTERQKAILPRPYDFNGYKILYPKDPKGGGSWIAVNELGHVMVLLNGAVKAHRAEPPYRKSRGLVLLDLAASDSALDSFEEYDCTGIEPFTIILFENNELWSGKWDGKMKWLESLNSRKPQIWSSVTLYSPGIIRQREGWFNDWIARHDYPGTLDIMHFHQKGGDGDPANSILINRGGKLMTNSISIIRVSPGKASFRYLDLQNEETVECFLELKKKTFVKA
jgi:hypothetical protein